MFDSHKNGVYYRVQSGDTLNGIIHDYYGITHNSDHYPYVISLLQALNPHVKDPDRIYSGNVLRLQPVDLNVGVCRPVDFAMSGNRAVITRLSNHRLTATEYGIASQVSWLEQNHGFLKNPANVLLTTLEKITGNGQQTLLRKVKDSYKRYKGGEISKGKYDYQRRKSLKAFAKKAGPFEKLLFNQQTTSQAIRISRSKIIPATQVIDNQIGKITRIAKIAGGGGVILGGLGMYMTYREISHADDRQKKNEIFVEALGSLVVGTASGVLLLALVSGPVGWSVVLLVASSSVAAGWLGGKAVKALYDKYGNEYDMLQAGSDALCKMGVKALCN